MQRIILISGFGGSGKSTCAQLLWEAMDDAAIVEADHLFRIKPLDVHTAEGRERIGRLKLQNSLSVLQTFADDGFKNVIVEGLVWSQQELDAVMDIARMKNWEVWCFWLKTSKDVRHERVLARSRDEADSREFLQLVENSINDPTPLQLPDGHYHEIVTDTLTPQEVVKHIENLIAFI